MKMPFGKFEGEEVSTLPKGYLRWLLDNVNLYGRLAEEVRATLRGEKPKPSFGEHRTSGVQVEQVIQDFAAQLDALEQAPIEKADVVNTGLI
jgi:hypothetical protein